MNDRFVAPIDNDVRAKFETDENQSVLSPYTYAVRSACFDNSQFGVYKRRCAVVKRTADPIVIARRPLVTLDWLFDFDAARANAQDRAHWMPNNLFDARGGRLVVLQDDGGVACRWAETGAVSVQMFGDAPLPSAVRGLAVQRRSLETLCALRNGTWRLIDDSFSRSRAFCRTGGNAHTAYSLCTANKQSHVFWAAGAGSLFAIDTRTPLFGANECKQPSATEFVDGVVHCAESDTLLSVHSASTRRVCVYDARCLRGGDPLFTRPECDAAQWMPFSEKVGVSTLACCVSSGASGETQIELLDASGEQRCALALPPLDKCFGHVKQLEFSNDARHALALTVSAVDKSTHLYIASVEDGSLAHRRAQASAWIKFNGGTAQDLNAVHLCVDHDAEATVGGGRAVAALGSSEEWLSLFAFGGERKISVRKPFAEQNLRDANRSLVHSVRLR